jgi:glycosyltransferase involved in cell wall biosynthesis
MVAYLFPPLGGVGVLRQLKFAAYLPESGWEPTVLTVQGSGYEILDPDLLRLVPSGTRVVRTRTFEPWWPAYRAMQGVHARFASLRSTIARSSTPIPNEVQTDRAGQSGKGRSLAAAIFFPDEQLAWLPMAVRTAVGLDRRRSFDAIYSTSGPITDHLVAGLVKRRTGLPWIADFRDPWIGHATATPLPGPHRVLQRRIERWIVETADRVVSVTPGLTESLQRRYPVQAWKMQTITNGYDRADLKDIPATHVDNGRFRLVSIGSQHGDRELEHFLAGLEGLLERRPDLGEKLEVEFVGWVDRRNQEIAARFAPRLRGIVRFTDFRPRNEALAMTKAADAGLFLVDENPRKSLIMGGKLFEYVGLDVPVLAMVPAGDARNMLVGLGWGILADPDPESVTGALERMLDSPRPTSKADPEGRYDRRNLTRQLAALLDDLVDADADGDVENPRSAERSRK